MNCPGSVGLIAEFGNAGPELPDPEYRSLGTSAHALGERCLREKVDAWEFFGETFGEHVADYEMVTSIQIFLDECRRVIAAHPGGEERFELLIEAPDFHPQFYGRLDWRYLAGDRLFIRDYKHGEGIVVEIGHNVQVMYYAYGELRKRPQVVYVDIGIVQPRAAWAGGAVRVATLLASYILEWAETTLRPAMERTAVEKGLNPGEWCRFCPARLVCPALRGMFAAAATASAVDATRYTPAFLGQEYQLIGPVKAYIAELERTVFTYLNTGEKVPGCKLVQKKANRVFKDDAEVALHGYLGKDIYTKPALKSPAEIERLGGRAKELVATWAYTPMTGLTAALDSDPRTAIVIKKPSETFKSQTDETR